MSSEEISLIASEPFIRKFVYAIVQNIRAKNFVYEDKHVIHAEMVPRVSEKVMQASLRERVTPRMEVLPVPIVPPIVKKRDMSALAIPVGKPQPRMPIRHMPPQRMTPPSMGASERQPVPPMIETPAAPQGTGLSQNYGKITPLLNDPSVSTIECSGVGKPLMIIRAGQKQGTRIVLSANEIKEILQKVSDAIHIPLLEGVFRAAVDNFSINAVISEMIGSRFIIKKQTAYAMLER